MGNVIKLRSREDVIETILFELIVLATDVPKEDKEISAASIATLSGLPADVVNVLTLSSNLPYDIWKEAYAKALAENGLIEVAEEINNAANTYMK